MALAYIENVNSHIPLAALSLLSFASCGLSPRVFKPIPQDGYLPPYDAVTEGIYWRNSRTIYNAIAERTGLFSPISASEPTEEKDIFRDRLEGKLLVPYDERDAYDAYSGREVAGMLTNFTVDAVYHAKLAIDSSTDAFLPSGFSGERPSTR